MIHLPLHTPTKSDKFDCVGQRFGIISTYRFSMVCHLLGSAFNYVIQFSLGLIAISILYFKHRREPQQRPFNTWLKDTSKQIVGLLWGHLLNLILAIMMARHEDQCVPYFVNYLIDSILGLGLNLLILQLLRWLGLRYQINVFDFGNYHTYELTGSISNQDLSLLSITPPSRTESWRPLIMWFKQVSIWLLIITLVKLSIFFFLIYPIRDWWVHIGALILHGITDNDVTELVLVMVIIPFIVNICQFVIQDNFLKRKPDTLDDGMDLQLDLYWRQLSTLDQINSSTTQRLAVAPLYPQYTIRNPQIDIESHPVDL